MIEKLIKDINTELKVFFASSSKDLNLKNASRLLYNGMQDFLARGGKRIRPVLFLLSYLGYTKRKNISYKKLIRSSLALELLHDFLLIHDDIIDKSALRRGKPSLHQLYNKWLGLAQKNDLGSGLGIVTGDIIFALAIEAFQSIQENPLRKEKALNMLAKIVAHTGIGEFIDVVNNIKDIKNVNESDIFRIYTLKTAKYTFNGPLVIGATLAGIDKNEIRRLEKLGILLGQAFQIHDDFLGIFSTSKKIGKPIISDLDESKKTLLVWRTYKKLKGKNKSTFKRILEKNKNTYRDLAQFRKLIKNTASDIYCIRKSKSLLRKANLILVKLKMKAKYRNTLIQFINNIFNT